MPRHGHIRQRKEARLLRPWPEQRMDSPRRRNEKEVRRRCLFTPTQTPDTFPDTGSGTPLAPTRLSILMCTNSTGAAGA